MTEPLLISPITGLDTLPRDAADARWSVEYDPRVGKYKILADWELEGKHWYWWTHAEGYRGRV